MIATIEDVPLRIKRDWDFLKARDQRHMDGFGRLAAYVYAPSSRHGLLGGSGGTTVKCHSCVEIFASRDLGRDHHCIYEQVFRSYTGRVVGVQNPTVSPTSNTVDLEALAARVLVLEEAVKWLKDFLTLPGQDETEDPLWASLKDKSQEVNDRTRTHLEEQQARALGVASSG